ncbi:hypothetical protein LTR36_006887 [Oleoguttula mirabilis]|uniref:Rrp15p-domain-containing protein n=1 Tax=Oleoguttula mirabilis TaxID=1507867 RepID=A0AAV9JBE1_9PEZI|nr:hypothetical protein LTR36_006887 [Oleoguttula mirabilis]
MAPVTTKRRRVEDEVPVRRPKKKVKKVKKQTDYYSSSSDEDVPAGAASDAPKGARPAKVEEVVEPTGANSMALAVSRPKPILKRAPAVPKPQPASEEAEEEGEAGGEGETGGVELELDEEVDEVTLNTALNLQLAESEDDDDDDDDIEDLAETDEPDLASSSDGDEDEDDADSDPGSETTSATSTTNPTGAAKPRKKRNDPTAFATSITKILTSKLTTNKRADPVLSRSKSAADANKTLADDKLAAKARSQIRAERKAALEKGRVRDVLGLESEGVDTGLVLGEEKRLKKTAQRGVVKLFNAVRAAQVKGEEAGRLARSEGVVGMGKRGERVNEMSKQGFLDLISAGGK